MTVLRDANEGDFDSIVALNAAEEHQTSPMSHQRLSTLDSISGYHKVAEENGEIAGFLLAMLEAAPYQNDNYSWFAARYKTFVYIDRVVVSAAFSGKGIGSTLYKDLFTFARDRDAGVVVCEYNLEPPNPASAAFHTRWGFRQLGSQHLANGSKLVSLQVAEL